MDGNRITGEGVESLSRSNFSNVMFLHLCANFLGNKGMEALSKGMYPNLVDLRLSTSVVKNRPEQNR
jgi:hypothetical protein